MILLEPGNRILAETVAAQINLPEGVNHPPIDVNLCDLDDVSYKITVDRKNNTEMNISMYLPCFDEIKNSGGQAAFDKTFSKYAIEPLAGQSVSICIKFADCVGIDKAALIDQISRLKPIVMGGLFVQYFNDLKNGKVGDTFKFQLRADTTAFLCPRKEGVTVIYQMNFAAKMDQVIGYQMMNEFVGERKSKGFAPPVSFTVNPPAELAKYNIQDNSGSLGFISFVILPSHVTNEAKIERAVNVLVSFRNFVQYHLKCSKSYLASRMRYRAGEMLKVLNRARLVSNKKKEYKTASGKTFVRRE